MHVESKKHIAKFTAVTPKLRKQEGEDEERPKFNNVTEMHFFKILVSKLVIL